MSSFGSRLSANRGARAKAAHLSSRQSISRGCGICTGSRRDDTPHTARSDSGGSWILRRRRSRRRLPRTPTTRLGVSGGSILATSLFFQQVGDDDTEWGPRDPLSKQTTLCAEVKEECARIRNDLGFDYDVEACSARQRTFLWQVSQPACGDVPATSARYLQFLGLMKKHGYRNHFFVPSYDIDFAWHTHMLASTTAYLRETSILAAAPGGVDHDDSVNQRHETSKLHDGWKGTNELWALELNDASGPIDEAGVNYRGEPPDWWFKRVPSDIFRVRDDFLSPVELGAALESLRCEANIRARSHSGLDMVCQVNADVMRRLKEQLDAEGGAAASQHVVVDWRSQTEREKEDGLMAEVPARVCPASKSVPQHKDKPGGKGACVSSWTCVVYLTHHLGSALVLKDDVTGREFRVAIEPGRMCCWPNSRFSHRVDVDAAAAQGTELTEIGRAHV